MQIPLALAVTIPGRNLSHENALVHWLPWPNPECRGLKASVTLFIGHVSAIYRYIFGWLTLFMLLSVGSVRIAMLRRRQSCDWEPCFRLSACSGPSL